MRSLNQAIDDYLVLRRSLGFKLREYGECLREFVSFLKKNGSAHITNKLASSERIRRTWISTPSFMISCSTRCLWFALCVRPGSAQPGADVRVGTSGGPKRRAR